MAIEFSLKERTKNRLGMAVRLLVWPFFISFIASVVYLTDYNPIPQAGYLLGIFDSFVLPYETYTIEFDETVSEDVQEELMAHLSQMEYEGQRRFRLEDSADIVIGYSGKVDEYSLMTSYLLPVGHLYWIRGEALDQDFNSEVIAESDSVSLVRRVLGEKSFEAKVKESEGISSELELNEEKIGVVELSRLNYEMKLLSMEDKYFLDDLEGGIEYSLRAQGDVPDSIFEILRKRSDLVFEAAFDTGKLTKLNMTGVTAITRALASKTDSSGSAGYAAERISEFLRDADLVHVSNEVSFVPGCTPVAGVRFCSKPEYIKALEDSGVNIVELTGNHNNDYGSSYNAESIEMYKDRGWSYFGGGLNSEDASEILYQEVNGNTVAFIGYNYYDTLLGTGAIAGEARAGSNSYSEDKMRKDIAAAGEEADVVIVDFQFQECYSYPASDVIYPICYKPVSSPNQTAVFRKAVDFGADIVVGVQAHQPQTYEIYNEKLIFYGLGNLFFDQFNWIGTRHGLVLTHYLYEGELIQTKITTTNFDGDLQTYVSTGEERELLLELLRDAR